jgi:CSLREA domain-containing protein
MDQLYSRRRKKRRQEAPACILDVASPRTTGCRKESISMIASSRESLRVLTLGALFAAPPLHAAVFVVNSTLDAQDAAPGNEVCATAVPGQCTLRAAITEANALAGPDSITVPAGTYRLTLAGNENANAGGDLDITSELTINGAGDVTAVDGNHLDRVFHVSGAGTALLNRLRIQNGLTAKGADAPPCTGSSCYSTADAGGPGGGVYNEGALTLRLVVVAENATGAGGKGANISSCGAGGSCLAQGGAGGSGAGVFSSGTLTVEDSTFDSNVGGSGGAAGANTCGGGFSCFTFPGDGGNGGGLAGPESGGVIAVSATSFLFNTAYDGGAIQQGGTLSVSRSRFTGNQASHSGGAINCNSASLACTISGSTFNANSASGGPGGGAIGFFNNGPKTVTSSTISGNSSSPPGGGIRAFSGPVTLSFVTIVGNTTSAGDGGGIAQTFDNVTMSGSILANNVDSGGEAPDCAGTITSGSHNLVKTLTGCTFSPILDITGQDPILGGLEENGGPTMTHMPQAGSAAIDGGAGAACGVTLTTDQRGVNRPIGVSCDIGAAEVEPISDASGDGVVSVVDVFYDINFLFAAGAAPKGRADANGDDAIDVLDVFFLINYLFAGGPAPA